MEKISLGNTDLKITPICYGTWEIGGMPFFQTPEKRDAIKAIHTALATGINFIDTAPVYGFGRAEELLGEALQGKRGNVVLATKCGLYWESDSVDDIDVNNSRDFIRKDIEGSLRRLRTDFIDLYQVHWPEFKPRTPIEETMQALEELKGEGKIGFYGVSNFSRDNLEEAVQHGTVSTLQNQYSILMDSQEEEIRFCQEQGIAFMAYSPLHRGLLTNQYSKDFRASNDPMIKRISEEANYDLNRRKAEQLFEIANSYGVSLSSLALNYTLRHTGVDVAIVGSKTPKHIGELANTLSFNIKNEDVERIMEILCQ